MQVQVDVDALTGRIKDLEAALNLKNQTLAVTFRLTPALNNLLGLLIALPVVTAETMRQRLELVSDAKVAMHRLRAHMKPFGIFINSRRNVGYWLEHADKERIVETLKNKGALSPAGSTLAGTVVPIGANYSEANISPGELVEEFPAEALPSVHGLWSA